MNNVKKIYLCTTNRCQLHCDGCYVNSILQLKELPLNISAIQNILTEVQDGTECVFHGGEPFFDRSDKNIQSYIDLVKEYPNIRWSATTNLVYNITPKLLELFNLFHNKFIKTSYDVDNYRFKTNEQLEMWENNVHFLLKQGFCVEVLTTVNKNTILHEPTELLNYFYKLGIRYINFERITDNGRAIENKVRPTNKEVNDWLYRAFKYNQEIDMKVALFDELVAISKGAEPLGCRRRECMNCVMTINNNGTVSTCPNMTDTKIGCIECDNKLKLNQDIRNKLIQWEKTPNQKCLTCKYYKLCKGDCCQLKFDETGCPGLTKILEEIIK